MKIALLLSGQFRDGKECFKSIKSNLLDVYNPDVFISYFYEKSTPSECNISDLINLYNPKGIKFDYTPLELIDVLNKIPSFTKPPETNPISLFNMWYGIKKVNELKSNYENENKFKYDVVIKCRFDINLIEIINIKERINTIHIPIGWDHRGGYNDIFAYGDSQCMDYYCSTFNYLIEYLNDGNLLHPESLLKVHLDKSDASIMRHSMKMSLRGMNIHELEYRIK
jgi:hypothetical protein